MKLANGGEDISCVFLQKNGYNILERNFECKQGEIDIVAWEEAKKELVFIEVKTRTNRQFGMPAEAVNEPKKKHIYKAAEYYIYINRIKHTYIRIDVIEVYLIRNKVKINHIKQIF